MLSRRSAPSSTAVLVLVIVLSAAVFVLDLVSPLGVAIGILYVAIVLAAQWAPRPRDTVIAAALGTVLIVAGALLSPAEGMLWTDFINRFLALFAIWATAGLSIQRKRAEIEQARMIRELDHRVKNNLAAVLSVADQTVANSRSLSEFTPAFAGRLRSMAIAHDMLARNRWRGAELRGMVERVVDPYGHGHPERFVIEGPDTSLPPEVAPSISMVLQELATNAARYGALSEFDGRVRIEWGRGLDANGRAELHLTWSETGGPPVEPPSRTGFGTTLIERMIAYQARGHATLEYDREGVRCVITVPLERARLPKHDENGDRTRA